MFNIVDNTIIECEKDQEQFAIPYGIKKIAHNVFSNSKAKKIILPDTLETIENGAFKKCVNVSEINLPNNLIFIGAEAFLGCAALKSINIPEKVDILFQSTFQSCGLTELKIPNNVKRIYWGAFRRCDTLEHVVLEEGVESIGECVFELCPQLKSIFIPPTVIEIADSAFFLTDNITFIVSKDSFAEKYASRNNIKYVTK